MPVPKLSAADWLRALVRSQRTPDAGALLLLAFLTLVFFWPVTLNLGWIPRGGGDLVSFLWPTYSYAADALREGRLPLWNHSLYSGAPFAADNQSGLFYPLNLMASVVWPGFPYRAMEWLVIAHVWLAGAGMYAFVRSLLRENVPAPPVRLAVPAALAAALAYMFSDVFVTHIGNLNILAVSAWLPWAAAALHRGLARRSLNWCLAAAACLGAAALAGHAQMTLIISLGLGAYGPGLILTQPPAGLFDAPNAPAASGVSERRMAVNFHRGILLGVVFLVGFGLSSLSVIPALEMTAYTARARLDYATAAEYSLPWAGLAGWFSPLVFGRGGAGFWADWPRVGLGYSGIVTLWLAGLAPWRGPAGRVPRALATVGGLGLLLALGENTPIHRLFYTVLPGFASLRVPARFVLLSGFAVAALAGYGLVRLPTLPRRRVQVWTVALAVGLLSVSFAAWLSVPGHSAHTGSLVLGLAVALGLLVLGAVLGLGRTSSWGPAAVAALIATDLIGHGAWVEVERNDPTVGFQHRAATEFLLAQPGPVRMDNASSAWSPDAAARLGLEDIGGISNPLALAAYSTYLGAVGPRGSPLYNFLNAQFVIADKGQPPADSRFVPVFAEDPAVDIYLNTVAQPRIRLAYHAILVSSGEAVFGAIHAPAFDPEQTVVLDTTSARVPPLGLPPPADASSNVFYTAYAPEAHTVVAQTPGPAYLVFSEVWYPGWRVWVNGVEAPLYRANFAFRAVYLPAAGEHIVEMRFDPLTWKIGLGLTLLTLAMLLLRGLVGLRARRRAMRL